MSLSVALWNDLADPVFDDVGLADFKSRASLLGCAALSFFVFYYFSLTLVPLYFYYRGWSLWTDRVSITLSQPCTADLF